MAVALKGGGKHPRELVGTGRSTTGAVDAPKTLKGKLHRSALQKRTERLKVAVAASQIFKIMNLAVDQVEVYQLGTDQPARCGSDMPDAVLFSIDNYSEIVTFHCTLRLLQR